MRPVPRKVNVILLKFMRPLPRKSDVIYNSYILYSLKKLNRFQTNGGGVDVVSVSALLNKFSETLKFDN